MTGPALSFADFQREQGPVTDDLSPAAFARATLPRIPGVVAESTRQTGGVVANPQTTHLPEPLKSVADFLINPALENPLTTAGAVLLPPVGAYMAGQAAKRIVDYGAQKAAEMSLPADTRAIAEADPERIQGREAATLASAFALAPLIHGGVKTVREMRAPKVEGAPDVAAPEAVRPLEALPAEADLSPATFAKEQQGPQMASPTLDPARTVTAEKMLEVGKQRAAELEQPTVPSEVAPDLAPAMTREGRLFADLSPETFAKETAAPKPEQPGTPTEPEPVLMHAGLPSPAPMIEALNKTPVVARLKDAFNIIVDPAARSPEATKAAGIIRAQTGEMARTFEQAAQTLESFRTAADKMPEPERLAFIDQIERGGIQPTADKGTAAAAIRKVLDTTRDEIRALGTGKLENFIRDYFPHIWEDPKQAASVMQQIMGKRPLAGSGAFLKQRTIPTTLEGIEAGLKPMTTNPVDLTLLKLREMQRYLMAQRAIAELKTEKLVQFVPAGAERPTGYARINDRIATVYGPREGAVKLPEGANITPEEVTVPGRRIMGEYWAPEPVARILNNYLSPGLRGNALYDAFRGVGNTLNQAQLGLSAFHMGFTSMDAAVSRTALGIEQLAAGKVLTGGKTIASTPFAPFTNILHGAKLRAEYLKPGTQGGDLAALAQAVADAGGRIKMDSFYRNAAPERFMQAWRQRKFGTMAANSIPAFFQTAMKPVMEYVVPRQKLGVFADLAREALSKLPDDAPLEVRRKAMADAWDSVDNRLGQLVYDNLFWDKTFKDLAMASVRSVGWNLGTIREIGGGISDISKLGRGELTHRTAYIAALPITVGLAGAITQYLYTGAGPQTLKDYFYPQTGTEDADGNPNRVQLPSYMKDVAAYANDPWQTIKHKINPSLAVIADMLNNEDFYGNQIRNKNDPAVQQLAQSAAYFGQQFLPFAIRNITEERDRGDKSLAAGSSFIGITPAPRRIIRSDAQNLMMRLAPQAPSGATPEQAEASQVKGRILAGLRRGEDVSDRVDDAVQRGIVGRRELNLLAHRAGVQPLAERFKRLSLTDALEVFNASTDPRERALWLPILQRKAAQGLRP